MVDFGQRMRQLRQSKGLTQKQLASMLGLSKSVISAYETDLRLPSYDILIQLASIFSVTTDFLLGIRHEAVADISGLADSDVQMIIALINRLKSTVP